MADTKITALTAITTVDPAVDVLPIVDISDTTMAASGTTKKITSNQILGAGGTATLASATISGDLTVRTNKLTVASTGVGINGTSAAYPLEINGGASASTSQFKSTGSSVIARFTDGTAETGYIGSGIALISGISRTDFGIASNGALVFGVSTGLGMTLNSTGLGVGTVPANGIRLATYVTTAGGPATSGTAQSAGSLRIGAASTAGVMDMGTAGSYSWIQPCNSGNLATNYNLVLNPNGGELLMGTTNASVGVAVGLRTGDGGGRLELGSVNSTNSNIGFDMYSTGAAAYRFYVGYGGTVFATNTTISAISDARLKENVQDLDVGLDAILALKPRKFDWKAGKGKDIKGDRGFIAQEFEQVFPQLVDEWKDNAPEGEAPYKSVRQDLIPVLVKAIQELAAEVNALKNA
jgi:hypothetical protein